MDAIEAFLDKAFYAEDGEEGVEAFLSKVFALPTTDPIEAFLDKAFNPSQPRDEAGRWRPVGAFSPEAERLMHPNVDRIKGITVFHGTSTEALEAIKEEGLLPGRGTGGDAWLRSEAAVGFDFGPEATASAYLELASSQFPDRKASVFATTSPMVAVGYAEKAAEITASNPVVIVARVPLSEFKQTAKPDELDNRDAYRFPAIKPEWVEGVVQLNKEATQLVYLVIMVDGETTTKGFNPSQPRDSDGKWTSDGGAVGMLTDLSMNYATNPLNDYQLVIPDAKGISLVEIEQDRSSSDPDKTLYLRWIQATPQGGGIGSRVMDKLTSLADAHAVTLTLRAGKRAGSDRLVRFYSRYGFKSDPNDKYEMAREPNADTAKAFNPTQPRDERGRWASSGGMDGATPLTRETASNVISEVVAKMDFDPSRVHLLEGTRQFTVGGETYNEFAHYSLITKQINVRYKEEGLTAEALPGVLAHEITHAYFDVWDTTVKGQMREARADRETYLDENGYLKPEHYGRFPALGAYFKWEAATGWAELVRTDGITSYSKAYWDARGKDYTLAVNETLAEIGRLHYQTGEIKGSPAWKGLYEQVTTYGREAKKAFNPGQPRDERGRWSAAGSGSWTAITREAAESIAQEVSQKMDFDLSRIEMLEGVEAFNVGGETYLEAAHYDTETKKVNVRYENPELSQEELPGVLAHEITHAQYDAWETRIKNEMETIRKDYDRYMLDQVTLRPEYREKFKAFAELSEWRVKTGGVPTLAKTDGITPYSKAYWKALGSRKNYTRPINETLAEMGRLKYTTGKLRGSPAWKELYGMVTKYGKEG